MHVLALYASLGYIERTIPLPLPNLKRTERKLMLCQYYDTRLQGRKKSTWSFSSLLVEIRWKIILERGQCDNLGILTSKTIIVCMWWHDSLRVWVLPLHCRLQGSNSLPGLHSERAPLPAEAFHWPYLNLWISIISMFKVKMVRHT